MTVRARFIKSVIATAKATETDMPWTRGATRREAIARREDSATPLRRVKTA